MENFQLLLHANYLDVNQPNQNTHVIKARVQKVQSDNFQAYLIASHRVLLQLKNMNALVEAVQKVLQVHSHPLLIVNQVALNPLVVLLMVKEHALLVEIVLTLKEEMVFNVLIAKLLDIIALMN